MQDKNLLSCGKGEGIVLCGARVEAVFPKKIESAAGMDAAESEDFAIFVQGHGTFGSWEVDTPTLIRYGQLTSDEFFITEGAAHCGVVVKNPSATDPLVILKHFGPGNPDLALEC